MMRRTLIAVIILLAVLGVIFALQKNFDKKKDEAAANAIMSIAVYNQTKNKDAQQSGAEPNDIIVYTLTAENPSDEVINEYVLEINTADISELAILIDAQGANYNSANNTLIWTTLDIPAKSSISKNFTVRVKESLPAGSDLVMTAKFNNEVLIKVADNQVAGIDTSTKPDTYTSPKSGASWWIVLLLSFITTVGLFLKRYWRKIVWR